MSRSDIRYCGRPIGSLKDGMLRCGLCRVRVDGPGDIDTLKMLEDAADRAFWTCGTPLWSWPQGVMA